MPKTISFTGGSDFDFEANDIARKRAMAEALLAKSQQGMPGTQVVSGIAVRNSPLQGIAQLLQGYGANKQMEDLSRRERELGASKRADMAKAFESYNAMRQGNSSFAPPEGAEMGPVEAPGVFTQKKADPRGAAMAAILSGHQPLQQLGMMDLQNASKGLDPRIALEMAKTFTNDSIVAHNSGTGPLIRKPKMSVTPKGVVVADAETGALVRREDLSMDEKARYDAAAKEYELRQKAGEFAYNTGREAPPLNLPRSYTGAPQAAAGAMPMPQAAPAAPRGVSVPPQAHAAQADLLRAELANAPNEAAAVSVLRALSAIGEQGSRTFAPQGSAQVAPAAQGALPTKQGDAMALLQEKARLETEQAARKGSGEEARENRKVITGMASERMKQFMVEATASEQTLQNVGQIRAALNSGKVILGPTADVRLAMRQIGDVMGVGGKNNEEVLTNTRNMLQGLARQELAGAVQMKGQGQITENERKIIAKAESGHINNMSAPEIKALVDALEKTSNLKIKRYQDSLNAWDSGGAKAVVRGGASPSSGGKFDFSEIDRMTGFKK